MKFQITGDTAPGIYVRGGYGGAWNGPGGALTWAFLTCFLLLFFTVIRLFIYLTILSQVECTCYNSNMNDTIRDSMIVV